MSSIQTRIKQRFDELSNWTSENNVLLNGELAVVNCGSQIRFKIGDGSLAFNELPFIDETQLSTKNIYMNSIAQGIHAHAVPFGLAAGAYLCANANFSQSLGYDAVTLSSDTYAFTWNGDDTRVIADYYQSHGKGTFNINPADGLSGVYIGEENLAQVIAQNGGNKVFVDDRISGTSGYSDLSVVKLNASEYAELVTTSSILSNSIYIVEDTYEDMYGMQVKNVAPPTDLSDAATKEYVDNAVGGIDIPIDLSSFTNSPGYTTNIGTITGITMNGASKGTSGNVDLGTVLTAHQSLANYYTKTETSSAVQLANTLASIQLSEFSQISAPVQTLNSIHSTLLNILNILQRNI